MITATCHCRLNEYHEHDAEDVSWFGPPRLVPQSPDAPKPELLFRVRGGAGGRRQAHATPEAGGIGMMQVQVAAVAREARMAHTQTPTHKPQSREDVAAEDRRNFGDTQARPGSVAVTGPDSARQGDGLKAAVRRAVVCHGEQTVMRALRVLDTDLLEFAGWFHTCVERQAAADRDALGGRSNGSGSSDGILLTRAMRLEAELPILLRRIMDDPCDVVKGLDNPSS
jgi:hypothetical protein